jgi:hypothetical protein
VAISLPIISTFDNKGVNSAVGAIQGLGSKLVGLGALVAGAFAVKAVFNFAKEAVMAAEVAEQYNNRIRAVAEATGVFGNRTNQVTADLIKFADAHEMVIGQEAELIKGVQATLLSFKGLSASAGVVGGNFERATKAAFDMGAALEKDAAGQAMALAKALEDPVRGLTALRRSGTMFTEQQQDMIRTMVEAGDVLGAQNLILTEIESQYGGTAEATALWSERLRLAFDQVKDAIGLALTPSFEAFAKFFMEEVQPPMLAFFENDFPRLVGKAGEAFAAVQPVFEEVGRVLKDALGIDEESSLLEGLLDKIAEFEASPEFAENLQAMVDGFNDMLPDLKELVPLLLDLGKVVIPFLLDVLPHLIPVLTGLVQGLAGLYSATKNYSDETSETVAKVPEWAQGLTVFSPAARAFAEWWLFMSDSVTRARMLITAGLDMLKFSFEMWGAAILLYLETLPGKFLEIGGNIIDGLLDGLKAAWKAVEKWVREKAQWIADTFARVMQIGSPSKVFFGFGQNIVQGLVNGLDSLSPEVDVAMNNLAPLPGDGGFASVPGGVVSPMGGDMYNITVNAGIGTNGAQVGEQIVAAIKRYERSSGKVFASA